MIVVEGGYVAAGRSRSFGGEDNDLWLLRVDEDGNEIWSFGYGNESSEVGWAVVRTEEDNGYAIAGWEIVPDPENEGNNLNSPVLLKLDENGEEEWFNRYPVEGFHVYIHDLVRTPDNGYALVGGSYEDDPVQRLAYILYLDIDGNFMWERADGVENGERHEYNSAVLAEDGGVTTAGQAFGSDLEGYYQGLFAKIEPTDLPPLILSRNPEDSIIFVRQNGAYGFSVDARDPEDADLTYRWILDGELLGEEDLVVIDFPETGDFQLRVDVADERWVVSTGWLIHVFNLIASYLPLETEIEVDQHTMVGFSVTHGLEGEEPQYHWLLNGEECCDDAGFNCAFDQLGEFIVEVQVIAHGLRDTVTWNVTVIGPESVIENSNIPRPFALSTAAPNPFNTTTTLTYQLPERAEVNLDIYDTHGRMITSLVNGVRDAGYHQACWTADDVPDGLYFVVLNAGVNHEVTKLVLLR